jgi:hypothetical protein
MASKVVLVEIGVKESAKNILWRPSTRIASTSYCTKW